MNGEAIRRVLLFADGRHHNIYIYQLVDEWMNGDTVKWRSSWCSTMQLDGGG